MSLRRMPVFFGLLLLAGGCTYHAQEHADEHLSELIAHPFDIGPADAPVEMAPPPTPVPDNDKKAAKVPPVSTDVQTTAFMEADKDTKAEEITKRFKIPDVVPGSETEPIILPKDPRAAKAAIERLYPKLPPVPEEPKALPGPDGCPYTLAALQQIAAANSPQLREAAANVETARGNWIQAMMYPNPNVGLLYTPSNDGSTPGLQGVFFDQVVQVGGKLKLQAAAAEMTLKNAELALKKARSDLSTAVRNAYFTLLVAKETVRVNKSLAIFTDEIYRIQVDQMGFAAPYEPAALRAQAYSTRLALKQATEAYIYSWKQLVAVVGLRQLPLTEVAGRVDRFIPYYDYDKVLAYVLKHHTDMVTAYNAVDIARYNLKAAQVTPIPNVEFNVQVAKDYVVAPKQIVPSVTMSFPLPIWDQNKGNIIAAEGSLMQASEEPHRVEVTITNNFAAAYQSYRSNLDGLEYYRKYILPDQVRYYRGVYLRRHIDVNAAFGDLVQAQQTLASNVASYLGILGTLWSSVVSVADFLQTDDLFQLAQPCELPELPDMDHLPVWMCHHPCDVVAAGGDHGPFMVPAPVPVEGSALPPPRPVNVPKDAAPQGERPTNVPDSLPGMLPASAVPQSVGRP